MANVKRVRLRRACFTLNNWTQEELDQMGQRLSQFAWVAGKELGKVGNTLHLQGYVNFKKLIEFAVAKELISPRAHVEKCRGSELQNWKYCTKDGDFVGNLEEPPAVKTKSNTLDAGEAFRRELAASTLAQEYGAAPDWRPWQAEIIARLALTPDKRKIFWYWESNGNVGKTFLCKWLAITYNVVIASGKGADVYNQVNEAIERLEKPDVILIDIPRSNLTKISYEAIEQLKNGFCYSGKYHGGKCIFPIPHCIVFANAPPRMSALSSDRWAVKELLAPGALDMVGPSDQPGGPAGPPGPPRATVGTVRLDNILPDYDLEEVLSEAGFS